MIKQGDTVFFSVTEEVWNKPFPKKRHHVYDTRNVILQGEVKEVQGNEFKVLLKNNNGFEKDGEEFVFNMGQLISNQNFQELEKLGQWQYSDNNK